MISLFRLQERRLLPVLLILLQRILFHNDIHDGTVVVGVAQHDITDTHPTYNTTNSTVATTLSLLVPVIALRVYTVEYAAEASRHLHHHQRTSVLHAQCILPHNAHQQQLRFRDHDDHEDHHTSETDFVKELCCRTILDRWSNQKNSGFDEYIDNSSPSLMMTRCENDIITTTFDFHPYHPQPRAIPTTTNNNGNTSIMVFSWVYEMTVPSSNITRTSTSIVSPPPYHIHKSVLSYDAFEDENQITHPGSTTSDHTDPISTSIPQHSQQRQQQSPSTLHVRLLSTLSTSGGMHRSMDHIIYLQQQPPPPLYKHSFNSSPYTNVTVYMLFHMPSHVFINVEDCFQYDTTMTNSEVTIQSLHIVSPSLPHTLNIDQEEPAFVSPAHLVLVQIQLLVHKRKMNQDHALLNHSSTVHFSTELHIRYPKPFPLNDQYPFNGSSTAHPNHGAATPFQHVWMAPPLLTSGQVVGNDINDDAETVIVVMIDNDDAEQQQSLLQLWIAAGHQSYFTTTIVITIAVAMIGSMIMLYDLSTITMRI